MALKIITAAASRLCSEAKIGHHLQQGNLDHPGRKFVLSLQDDFSIDGPNGRHKCLVSEVVGSSIIEVKEASELGMLSLKTARIITAQIILGLSYIHSCGIFHGGEGYFLLVECPASIFKSWSVGLTMF